MERRPDKLVELAAAGPSEAPRIAALLDAYLRELSQHREVAVGASEAGSYPYFDAYWSETGRHAFLIQHRSRDVGFAFVRDPESTGSAVHELAEFYIEPRSRRLGIGRRAALAIWARFPGAWVLQVHARNAGAVQFWTSCVEQALGAPVSIREVRADDGRRFQLDFDVVRAT